MQKSETRAKVGTKAKKVLQKKICKVNDKKLLLSIKALSGLLASL